MLRKFGFALFTAAALALLALGAHTGAYHVAALLAALPLSAAVACLLVR